MGTSVRGNLYWNTLLRIPVRIICFLLSIIVARLLEPSDFGILAVAMMCIGYANLMTNFGLGEAIIQQTITCKKTINSIFSVDLLLSVFIAIIFVIGAGGIASFFHDMRSTNVIRVMSLVFIISSFSVIPISILRRDSKFQIFSMYEMTKNLSMSVLTLILAYFNFGYWALAYGQLIPLFIFTVIICVKTRWRPGISFEFNLLRTVISFGGWSFLRTQANFFTSQIEKIIVGRALGSYSLGIYDKAKSIAIVPSQTIFMNINSVMYSSFSKNKSDNDSLLNHFSKSIFLISIISFPVYLGFVLISPYFVKVLLGDKWFEMVIPFQIVLSGYLFKAFGGILTTFNVAVGNYKTQTIYTIFSGLLLIILCFFLINYGVIGMSIAFFIYCITEFLLYVYLSLSLLKINIIYFLKYIFTGTWSSTMMFFATKYLAVNYFLEQNLFNLIMIILIGGIIYGFCVLIDFTKYSKDFKRKIFGDMSSFFTKNFIKSRS